MLNFCSVLSSVNKSLFGLHGEPRAAGCVAGVPADLLEPSVYPRQVSPDLHDEFDGRRNRFEPAELPAGFRHG